MRMRLAYAQNVDSSRRFDLAILIMKTSHGISVFKVGNDELKAIVEGDTSQIRMN